MEEELCRLRSQAELHRMQTTVIATLEGERAALERERDALRGTVDALRAAQRKVGAPTRPGKSLVSTLPASLLNLDAGKQT